MPIDYQKGKIYKIVCNVTDEIYIDILGVQSMLSYAKGLKLSQRDPGVIQGKMRLGVASRVCEWSLSWNGAWIKDSCSLFVPYCVIFAAWSSIA